MGQFDEDAFAGEAEGGAFCVYGSGKAFVDHVFGGEVEVEGAGAEVLVDCLPEGVKALPE